MARYLEAGKRLAERQPGNPRAMTICHVNLNKGFRGSGRQTEILISGLAGKGIKQRLAARAGSALVARLSGLAGLEIVELEKPFFLHPSACKGVDLVHAHTGQATHLAAIGHLAYRTPYVVTRRVDNPVRGNLLNRIAFRRAARVVALSQVIRQRLVDFLPELDVTIIPDALAGLPVDREAVERLRRRYAGKFLVGHTAELSNAHKGQLYLIRAARRLKDRIPELHVLLIGHGEDEGLFRNEARDLDNVELVGFVENVGDYLSILDVFAYPSLHEGMGSAILDAMDFGLPVVATDVDGIPDIVENGVTGLLVPPADADSLAEAMLRLFREPELRRALGRAGKERAVSYGPDRMVDRYLEVYESVLSGYTLAPRVRMGMESSGCSRWMYPGGGVGPS